MGFVKKTILSRIVDKYVENRINSIALGMLVKEVTRMKVIDDVNVVDGGFSFPTLALRMLEKEGGYSVTRDKVIYDFNVVDGGFFFFLFFFQICTRDVRKGGRL